MTEPAGAVLAVSVAGAGAGGATWGWAICRMTGVGYGLGLDDRMSGAVTVHNSAARKSCGGASWVGRILGESITNVVIRLARLTERDAVAVIDDNLFPAGAFGIIVVFIGQAAAVRVYMCPRGNADNRKISRAIGDHGFRGFEFWMNFDAIHGNIQIVEPETGLRGGMSFQLGG